MKYLHTMIRVKDLETSLAFYCEVLGFRLRTRRDFDKSKCTVAFLSSPDGGGELEITHNWDRKEPYQIGDGFGHLAVQVMSLDEIQKKLEEHGLKLSWGPGKSPTGDGTVAYVTDPDGYEIELQPPTLKDKTARWIKDTAAEWLREKAESTIGKK